jgi:hypothetical protein
MLTHSLTCTRPRAAWYGDIHGSGDGAAAHGAARAAGGVEQCAASHRRRALGAGGRARGSDRAGSHGGSGQRGAAARTPRRTAGQACLLPVCSAYNRACGVLPGLGLACFSRPLSPGSSTAEAELKCHAGAKARRTFRAVAQRRVVRSADQAQVLTARPVITHTTSNEGATCTCPATSRVNGLFDGTHVFNEEINGESSGLNNFI